MSRFSSRTGSDAGSSRRRTAFFASRALVARECLRPSEALISSMRRKSSSESVSQSEALLPSGAGSPK